MSKTYRKKLESIISGLTFFLEHDYSSRFKNLTDREDRQLFFLAKILAGLKRISEEIKEDDKILVFPTTQK